MSEELQQERKKTRRLEKELKRKEAAALLVLGKKSPGRLGGRRGRLIVFEDRQMAIDLIGEAVAGGRGTQSLAGKFYAIALAEK